MTAGPLEQTRSGDRQKQVYRVELQRPGSFFQTIQNGFSHGRIMKAKKVRGQLSYYSRKEVLLCGNMSSIGVHCFLSQLDFILVPFFHLTQTLAFSASYIVQQRDCWNQSRTSIHYQHFKEHLCRGCRVSRECHQLQDTFAQ